ncbi:MAG: ABC transporter ATP-binding protein [Synergistota bacterium]|nr:ABC transporter ATP-binding protein [Synergistota bacterium]
MEKPILSVNNLNVIYKTRKFTVNAVNDISFSLNKKETIGIVGETGAGKTTTALSIMRLLPERTGRITGGGIHFNGDNLLSLTEAQMQCVRGANIAMIFQDPMTSLNPVLTVGEQISEALVLHNTGNRSPQQIEKRVDEVLTLVGISPSRKKDYPHQFSGGMKQRIVIAIALACEPSMLIADEPTTALDVTIQAQVLQMIRDLRNRLSTSMIMITHDLGIVAQTCDTVAVMYAGELIEIGRIADIFTGDLHHPYSLGLFGSIPKMREKTERLTPIPGLMPDPTCLPAGCHFSPRCPYRMDVCNTPAPTCKMNETHQIRCHLFAKESLVSMHLPESLKTSPALPKDRTQESAIEEKHEAPLIQTLGLKKYFRIKNSYLHAVDDINLSISRGKTLGVVGESGCGKSTLGRVILRLLKATAGEVRFNGENILGYGTQKMREMRRKMQIILQDPYSSLNPRMSVVETIAEYMIVNKTFKTRQEIFNRAVKLMDTVGLARRYVNSYPHELDGGRRQRIGIARAISLDPEFIVCDEPVSALDVSIQAQILNLLMDIQKEHELTYLFITHDLSVVKHISDEILVMYLGQCVEHAASDDLFDSPMHPYTKALLSAVPEPDLSASRREISVIRGEITNPIDPPVGCRFAARCDSCRDICRSKDPQLVDYGNKHYVACFMLQNYRVF